MKYLLSTVALAATLGLAGAAQASLITFDVPSVIEVDAANLATYTEANFKFSGDAATFGQLDNAGSGGSPALYGLASNFLSLMAAGGSLFNLASFDYGALDNRTAVPPTILLVQGLLANNTLLTETLTLGPLGSFSFAGWTGLASVRFGANGDFVLDNLQLQAVPEPAGWALTALALAGLAGVRLTRRRARLR